MPTTLFERCGGFATIRRVVSDFYDRVLESPIVAHHFEGVDMRRLLDHQARFVSSLMGGPASYSDEHLRRTHEQLGITGDEFREVVELMAETLEDLGFAPEDVDAVAAELRRRQGLIVSA